MSDYSLHKVTIVILNWNGWQDTIECLESVYNNADWPEYEVLVVDNGSSDDSVHKIEKWASIKGLSVEKVYPDQVKSSANFKAKSLTLLLLPENIGYTGGNNVGIKYALIRGADFILILNNDTITQPGFLKPLVETALAEKNVALVGSVIYNYPQGNVYFAGGYSKLLKNFYETNIDRKEKYWSSKLVAGSSMLISSEFLKKEKYWLDDRLFIYGEEVEICRRALRKGFKVLVSRDSRVFHKVSAAMGAGLTPAKAYYIYRNKLLLMHDILSLPEKILFICLFHLKATSRIIYSLFKRNYKLAKAIFEALKDGWRGKTGKWKRHGA